MSRRDLAGFVVASVLAVVVLWRWWSTDRVPDQPQDVVLAGGLRVEEFHVNGFRRDPQSGRARIKRDLFWPRRAVATKSRYKPRPKTRTVLRKKALPVTPPKPKQPSQEEIAKKELANLKCVGVSRREHLWQAFLSVGDELYLAEKDTRIADRFIVQEISARGVVVQDLHSQLSATIPVLGK